MAPGDCTPCHGVANGSHLLVEACIMDFALLYSMRPACMLSRDASNVCCMLPHTRQDGWHWCHVAKQLFPS